MLNQELQYLWVYAWGDDGWCLAAAETIRNERPAWIDAADFHASPDLNMGVPVFRRTDHGLAQYFRFEAVASVQSREKYDRRAAA